MCKVFTAMSMKMIAFWVYRCAPLNFFLPATHPTLKMTRGGTPQYFALRKGAINQYVGSKNANHKVNPQVIFIKIK
jgi:hypothetical protein